MNAHGIAKVGTDVADISVLIATGLKGIHAFIGNTERGKEGTILVGSWSEYVKHFGGLLLDEPFPLFCKRALDAGCKLRIARALHYGDVTDPSTVTGTKASLDATSVNGSKVFSKSIGSWGNFIQATVVNAANGDDSKVDVMFWVDANGTKQELETYTVNKVITAKELSKVDKSSNLVNLDAAWVGKDLTTVTALFENVVTLVGGTDTGVIVPTDIIGDSNAGTGLHLFDNDSDFVRISAPSFAISSIDSALVNYAETRKDCRAILRTPLGVSGLVATEYRKKKGVYDGTGAAINSWYGSMIYGGVEVIHPITGRTVVVPALCDVAGSYSNKDNNAKEWFAAAGVRRGKLSNIQGIEYNLGSAARVTEADQVDSNGINAVIDDADYGVVYWGNGTLQREDTLLKHENVADLVIFLVRAIRPLAKSELFEPNDIATWKAIHRKVRPLLEAVKKGRGIWDYLYQGDQDIDKIEDAKINDPAEVDKGKHVFIIWIKPKVGMKYVGIKIAVTNSGVSFEEVSE